MNVKGLFFQAQEYENSKRLSVRSSHPEVFCGKGVLRNFEKLTEKHLYKSLLFNKVAGLQLY